MSKLSLKLLRVTGVIG